MSVIHTVNKAGFRWHGLFQGRWGTDRQHECPKNAGPNVYGDAPWNVRIVCNGILAYGGGPTLEDAVKQALEEGKRYKAYKVTPVKKMAFLDYISEPF